MSLSRYIDPFRLFTGAFVPNWLACRKEVSPGAKLAYARLCQYSGRDGDGVARPPQEELADELGVSARTAWDYLKELAELGLIEIERVGLGKPNLYKFLWHEWMERFRSSAKSANQDSQNPASLELQDSAKQEPQLSADPDSQDSANPIMDLESVPRIKREEEASPAQVPVRNGRKSDPAPLDHPPSCTLAKFSDAFVAAWRRWRQWLEERGDVRVTSMSEAAELLLCQRMGEEKSIVIIEFSILKKAKNLIWDAPENQIPRHLRAKSPAASSKDPVKAVPGLKQWIAGRYPRANPETPWGQLTPAMRRDFSKAHPHLDFRGLELQIYVGERSVA